MKGINKVLAALFCAVTVMLTFTACPSEGVDEDDVCPPYFTVEEGFVKEGTKVYIGCRTLEADIYYTTDGSTPDKNSAEYYYKPIEISDDLTIKAVAVLRGKYSEVAAATYVVRRCTATPEITVTEQTADSVTIALSCKDEESVIYYTTDGSIPDKSSKKYRKPFTVNVPCKVKVIAYNKNFIESEVASISFIEEQTVAASKLDEALKALPENTKNNPYRFVITGLSNVVKDSSEGGFSLYAVLSGNPSKFVILSFQGEDISFSNGALKDTGNLLEITLPEGMSSVPESLFYNCQNLRKVVLPESVTKIEKSVFYMCPSLAEVNIPSGVKEIGSSAFSECSALAEIVLPEGLEKINQFAFEECKAITELTIPASVTKIGMPFIGGCINLETLTVAEGNTVYDSRDNCNGIIQTSTNIFMAGCKTTVIPDSVIGLSDYSFIYLTNIENMAIPEGVRYIGGSCFNGCTNLTSINIPSTVSKIGSSAFYRTGFSTVTIPANVIEIGACAFGLCLNLKTVVVNAQITELYSACFERCSSLTKVVLPDRLHTISNEVFKKCDKLTSICFRGTEEQWNEIIKEDGWIADSSAVEIVFDYKD